MICNICNQKREEWKREHRSIISLWLNTNINNNFIMYVNNDMELLIVKDRAINNYWVKQISTANGNYKFILKEKSTNEKYAEFEAELNNEYLRLTIEVENKKIIIKEDSKYKMHSIWYEMKPS